MPVDIPLVFTGLQGLLSTIPGAGTSLGLVWIIGFGFALACVITIVVVSILAAFVDAKLAARIAGGNRTNGLGVIASRHPLKSAFKLLFKEPIAPGGADAPGFGLAPYFTFAGSALLLLLVLIAPGFKMTSPDTGALFFFALIGLPMLGGLSVGYASNSKYSLIGGMRAVSQFVSSALPFMFTVLGVVLIAGTFNLREIVSAQGNGLWYVALQPVGFVLFIIFTVVLAGRSPFDSPTARGDVAGGYLVEYTGARYGIMRLSSYAMLFVFSVFGTHLYLGGWNGPPSFELIAEHLLTYANLFWAIVIAGLLFTGITSLTKYLKGRGFLVPAVFSFICVGVILLHLVGTATGFNILMFPPVWYVIKVIFVLFSVMLLRWAYPKLSARKQALFSWKVLFPIALANLVITAVVVLLIESVG